MEKAFQSTHFLYSQVQGGGAHQILLKDGLKTNSATDIALIEKRTNSLSYSNKITNLEDTRGIFHVISFSISFYHETKFFDLILYSIYICI